MRAAEHPAISAKNLLEPRRRGDPDAIIDLTGFKGQRLRMKIRGVSELLRIDEKPVAELARLGIIERVDAGTDKYWHLSFDPAWGCLDLWELWIARQSRPETLEAFDAIRTVRDALRIPSRTPYPSFVTDAAFDYLEALDLFNGREARELLPFKIERQDPTSTALIERVRRRAIKTQKSLTPEAFAKKHLPAGLRKLPLTCLDDRFEDDFAAPSQHALSMLAEMTHLKVEAAIYIFRLAASGTGVKYVQQRTANLFTFAQKLQPVENDVQAAVRTWLSGFAQSLESGKVTRATLDEPLTALRMFEDLNNAARLTDAPEGFATLVRWKAEDIENCQHSLRPASAINQAQERQSRLTSSGPLAERLTEIEAVIEIRWHDIEAVLMKTRGLLDELDQVPSGHVGFTSTSHIEDDGRSEGAPGIRTDYWELWRPESYLDRLAAEYSTISAMPSILRTHKRGTASSESEPYHLKYVKSELDGRPTSPPYFVTLFSHDLMNGSWRLPREIRQRRFELIQEWGLPGANSSPAGLLDFDEHAKAMHRMALDHGDTLVPIESFALAMRMARVAFRCGRDTAMRSGELVQLRADAANLFFDEEAEMAYWTAYPKGAYPDEDDTDGEEAESGKRRYHVGERTLEALQDLQSELKQVFGLEAVAELLPPPQQIKGKADAQPYLLRARDRALGGGDLAIFLAYLTAGHGSYTIHDLRAAVAKDLYSRGVHPHVIQNLLGHAHMGLTRRYAKLTDLLTQKRKKRRSLGEGRRKMKMLALANAAHSRRSRP
ncbi:tyrosine-type recombinase/integrase [Qipengyuania sp. YIM B01966]|uniref:tyrosine-type recombinase/integrase n=1 Tax=Qipengyuania sp. YIM B01966 TaxID=2778646 RepID=UPI0018F4AE01|nr:tyrosine-type recombinase/integrase [Qipengyuania sp. YIM B01966]